MAREAVTRPMALQRRDVPGELYAALPESLHPVLRRVLAARHAGPGDLGTGMADLLPVGSLGGVRAAAALLADARRRGAPVLVVGDYDADGATATALVVSALRAMGMERVSYLVPNRFEYGYGFSEAIAGLAAQRRPDVVITVDNGVSSVAGVRRARDSGMEVLVTDHHLPGAELPDATVMVNPNLPGETFPSKALSGVGVAFYLLAALARELAARGEGRYEQFRGPVLDGLDLVALGTVADLVPLDRNNRILVAEGLRRIRASRARPGLGALFEVAGRDPAAARSADLGYAIAPRLNAAGRLTDMSLGIECLLCTDQDRARALARQLDELNRARQDLQARMQAEARQHVDALARQLATEGASGICLFDPGWHEGIVGLVASRVKEYTGCPVIAFAPGASPGELKGSARSVDGLHIRDVLDAVAAGGAVRGLSFGGHAMAAGLRLPEAQLEAFGRAFRAEVDRAAAGLGTGRMLLTDGPLDAGDLNLELAETLHFSGPWGQGFPEPLFDNEFVVVEQRVLREAHLRLALRHPGGGPVVEAIAFNATSRPGARARLVYRLGVNDYGGRRRSQLVVEHIQSA